MSLLTRVFSLLAFGQYNPVPPTLGNAQAAPIQIGANGAINVNVAAVTAGAPILALPVATASRVITTPTVANGFQVSAPFNTSAATLTQTMPPTPLRGMRVTVMDSGGFAAIRACTLTDANGYVIQNPFNPGSALASLSFVWSGYAATWEFITGDPTNGSFWQIVRSLQ